MKQRLDQLVVGKGLADNRSRAQSLIMAGQVYVDGRPATKAGMQVDEEREITLKGGRRYVSRGGLKFESANAKFNIDFTDRVVLDVGSSTGGFTDYALQHRAQRVYAVDVGTNQLDYSLRKDPRVVVMEKTDIRDVSLCHSELVSESRAARPDISKQREYSGNCLDEPADISVIDVSFISMRKVLPSASRLTKSDGRVIAMVKPQFEAGVKEASKHKGVIKNDTIRRRILKDFETWARQEGFMVLDKKDSEVSGAKGNVERFYVLRPIAR